MNNYMLLWSLRQNFNFVEHTPNVVQSQLNLSFKFKFDIQNSLKSVEFSICVGLATGGGVSSGLHVTNQASADVQLPVISL